MPLIDLRTDLKSLKYGQDRQGGGDSGLPYIKTDINTVDRPLNRLRLTRFDDGLIRGGFIGATNASIVDTLRIGKFLTDLPKGPLFIIKQIGLQRANPRLEIKKGVTNFFAKEPTRIYNLGLNTLAQVPVNAFGIHFDRHGILPIQSENTKYINVVAYNNENGANRLLELTSKFQLGNPEGTTNINTTANRARNFLGRLATTLGINIRGLKPEQLVISEYRGGPGSVYGTIGSTTINRTLQITNDTKRVTEADRWSADYAGKTRDNSGDPISVNYSNDLGKEPGSISQYPGSKDKPEAIDQTAILAYSKSNPSLRKYAQLQEQVSKTSKATIYSHTDYIQLPDGNISNLDSNYKYSGNTNFTILNKDSDYPTYPSSSLKTHIKDTPQSAVTQSQPSELGFPGTQKPDRTVQDKKFKLYNLFDRTNDGGRDGTLIDSDTMKIVFTPIQPFTGVETPIPFLGYLKNYDESYDSTWNDTQYVGRAEKFYIFQSFKKTANISFTVPTFTQEQLISNHKKLFALGQKSLAYALAGQYNENALLGGVIVKATVGSYLIDTPGIITNLKFDIVEGSPWDINAKYAQYLNITIGFTIIGDKLPIYENVKFTVQQQEDEETVVEDEDVVDIRTPLPLRPFIPPTFVDNTRNTSNQQRYVEQTLRANRNTPPPQQISNQQAALNLNFGPVDAATADELARQGKLGPVQQRQQQLADSFNSNVRKVRL